MQLSDFDYYLPPELIAQHPIEPRDLSRLMVLSRQQQTIRHSHFHQLLDYLEPGDTLVFNDTKVMPARLMGCKEATGAHIEVLLLKRLTGDEWEVLVKPGKKVRQGTVIKFGEELSCEVLSTTDFGGRIVRFDYQGIFEEILDRLGEMPLPPYITEKLADKNRYQTVYAREQGSAAAPTAGLHFTTELMSALRAKGIICVFITLHVGLGTFRPVNVAEIMDHQMHSEYYSITEEAAATVNCAKQEGRRVIAIGTTAVRTLETAAVNGRIVSGSGWTKIFIYPGYQYQMINALITNFHLPKSTLLMLVSALAGREFILQAYQEAVAQKYRFFSFGDAMLII